MNNHCELPRRQLAPVRLDDGPNPKTTPLVLDTLARHHIHAVFFMVGEMAENKSPKVAALVRRVLREGHVIASHTMPKSRHRGFVAKMATPVASATGGSMYMAT